MWHLRKLFDGVKLQRPGGHPPHDVLASRNAGAGAGRRDADGGPVRAPVASLVHQRESRVRARSSPPDGLRQGRDEGRAQIRCEHRLRPSPRARSGWYCLRAAVDLRPDHIDAMRLEQGAALCTQHEFEEPGRDRRIHRVMQFGRWTHAGDLQRARADKHVTAPQLTANPVGDLGGSSAQSSLVD